MTADVSCDSLFDGRLQCLQPRQGYRFSEDAVLLAHFAAPHPKDRVLDLGAGCGIISLILAHRHPTVQLYALEMQPQLADLARRNVELNGLQERLRVIEGDLGRSAELLGAASFDWVVSNPPYRKQGSGRLNPQAEQAAARHEIHTDLATVIKTARCHLRTGGRLTLVYPAERAEELLDEMQKNGLSPRRLQTVHSHSGSPGRLVLVEAVVGGGEELVILPPFFVASEPGGPYSQEMGRLYKV